MVLPPTTCPPNCKASRALDAALASRRGGAFLDDGCGGRVVGGAIFRRLLYALRCTRCIHAVAERDGNQHSEPAPADPTRRLYVHRLQLQTQACRPAAKKESRPPLQLLQTELRRITPTEKQSQTLWKIYYRNGSGRRAGAKSQKSSLPEAIGKLFGHKRIDFRRTILLAWVCRCPCTPQKPRGGCRRRHCERRRTDRCRNGITLLHVNL